MSVPFDIDAYRAERSRELAHENEFLRAENNRLYTLMADALRVAVAGTGVTPTALLSVIGDLNDTNLGIAAFIEEREREEARALLDRVVRVLKETS